MKRRALWLLAAIVLLIGAWRWASVDRCGEWPVKPPVLTQLSHSEGALKVGAARVPFAISFPTTVGGYGPIRSSVDKALTTLNARAVVLDVGAQRLNIVSLDVLLIPPQLRDAIGANQTGPTWVIATHTHTGPSGYDPRAASELAALGTFDPADQQRIVTAARTAIENATTALQPSVMSTGERSGNELVVARSGKEADKRVTLIRFEPNTNLVIVAGHPTLTPRRPDGLHADWPGLLSERLETKGGVTLVLQGSGGNASIDRAATATPEAAAEKLETLVNSISLRAQPESLGAAWNEVRVSLTRPDATRVAPSIAREAVENALCDDAEDIAVLHGLRLGELELLFVPLEPSLNAGLVLEEQARVDRLVSLADGYAGYVETVEVARAGEGESHRQYFTPELLSNLATGARLAGDALKPPR